ncbi:MAG: deoxycytidylate deaminase [Promethearchaeota archaeon]
MSLKDNVEKDSRISKDQYFMEIAKIVSKRSTCIRRSVGAVLVKDSYIVSTGYNGAPSGLPHCTPTTCLRNIKNVPSGTRHELCRGVHAEMNCIIQAAIHGTSIKGNTTLYSTHFPCILCTKMIINAGIKRVVYDKGYPKIDEIQDEMIRQSGISFEKIAMNALNDVNSS